MSEISEEKMLDLLADNATVGLSDEEQRELARLEAEFPELAGDESFELAAAAFQVADIQEEEMPRHLKNIILDDGEDFVRVNYEQDPVIRDAVEETATSDGIGLVGWLGWAVAGAACLVLGFTFLGSTETQVAKNPEIPKAPTVVEQRETLLASAENTRAKWEAQKNDWFEGKNPEVSGDVVWSEAKQEGYMTFEGLPVNDKSKEQYQLWIFDENQSDKTPVDGGVFDVGEDGKVTVPIDPKINVKGAKMFAITVENPGGVVVSDRKKLILIGKVSA